jgi:protein-S-isoprenylcysteine O-methyltransferase Ste14
MLPEDELLHIVLSVMFLAFLFERGYFQAKAMGRSGEARKFRDSKGKLVAAVLLFLMAQIWVIGSFIYLIRPSSMDWSHFDLPSWLRWVGAIIMGFGMALEFSTQFHLGKNYSSTLHISEEQTLVTSGPYHQIRHPMYSALFAVGIGIGLLSRSWYFLLPFIAAGIVIAFRIRREEEAMVEKFGEVYVKYAKTTGMFFPRVSKREELF